MQSGDLKINLLIKNIEVKDFNGCIQTFVYDFSTVVIDDNDSSLQHERLYPVPTKEVLTLEFVINADQQIEFTTLDMEGRLIGTVVGNYTRGFNTFDINVSKYPNAVYILEVKNNTERRYYKFSKVE